MLCPVLLIVLTLARAFFDVDGATDTILVINLAGRFVYLRTTQTFEIREETLGHQVA